MTFGRYRLLSLIGAGGMGQVYKAHDTMMDRDVAIKVLPPESAAEPGYEERFRREAHTAARLTEPHIIPIYEAGEIDGRLYLAMPVIEGVDVASLLRRDGPMSPPRAVHIVEQLAAALDAAHAVGLVHRDIKPSNALVTGRDFVYLIDFGIAHNVAATKLTKTGSIVGTFAYMAPERFSAGVTDARSDVYALACLLYECLTGRQPYPGHSMEQLVAGHLAQDPPRPSQHRPDLVGFDAVIATGMAKDPNRRYQSANALATAARAALAGAPSYHPHTPPAQPRFDYPAPTPPVPAWQQPATLAATQQGPPGWQPVPQPYPGAWGQPPRRRLMWPLIVGAVIVLAGIAAVGITGYELSQRPSRAGRPGQAPTTAQPAPTVEQTALEGLLLDPDQINTALGTSGMAPTGSFTQMVDDSSAVSDRLCLPLDAVVEQSVYATSGWTAMRRQQVTDHQTHGVEQAVVLFPSAKAAATFFTASTHTWPACANRQFTETLAGQPEVHTVGAVTNTNGTLTAILTGVGARSGVNATCQRALTAVSNVVIDVGACTPGPSSAGVNIVHQIAAKVPTA